MASIADFIGLLQQIVNMREFPLPTTGVVVPNSYDPQRGTVSVLVGSTATLADGSDPDAAYPTRHEPVQLLTNHIGQQGGPIGLERVLLIRADDGWRAILEHDSDDSPNAQEGEWHAHLRDLDVNRVKACFVSIQGDAARVSHDKMCIVIAPIVVLAGDQAKDGHQLVRRDDFQKGINDLRDQVQAALRAGFQQCYPGSGVPVPQVGQVTVEASQKSYSE